MGEVQATTCDPSLGGTLEGLKLGAKGAEENPQGYQTTSQWLFLGSRLFNDSPEFKDWQTSLTNDARMAFGEIFT